MLKISSISLLFALSLGGNLAARVSFPENVLNNQLHNFDSKISSIWGDHAKDFIELIDVDKVVDVVFQYLDDPEFLNFLTYVFSDEFKQTVWEFESMAEFKEAFVFLTDKGYDVDSAINFINMALKLPPFEKPKVAVSKEGGEIRRGSGITGLIEDVIAILPIKEMKELFENKLETNPELTELFETINSPEFLDIMKRMAKNPKFIEIKDTFTGYGFDFKYLCALAKDIFGEYYQGVFCEI